MIDAHVHLCSEEFDADLPAVMDRAKKAGVIGCLVNTETVGEFDKSLRMGQEYPGLCIPCVGVHPVQYERRTREDGTEELLGRSIAEADMEGMSEWLQAHHGSVVALGEVGLDFSPRYIHSPEDKERQRELLRTQIRLAQQFDLPLISHSRSAGKPTIELFKEMGAARVLLHAFDGSVKSAKPGIEAGFCFSIPPCIVRGEEKQKLVQALPMSQILLETDSPVLGPSKEERNEPANITVSVEWIAKLKGLSADEVVRVTTENAYRLFPKLAAMIK